MFRPLINSEFFQHRSAQAVFGKHALHGFIDSEIALFGQQFLIRNFFQAADVAGVIPIEFIFRLLSRQDHFIGVDDDDEIARIDVGGKGGFIFSAEHGRYAGCETAEWNSRGIYDIPLSFNRWAFAI